MIVETNTLFNNTVEPPIVDPPEIGTQYNKPLYKGHVKVPKICFPTCILLVHFEPPRRGQPLYKGHDCPQRVGGSTVCYSLKDELLTQEEEYTSCKYARTKHTYCSPFYEKQWTPSQPIRLQYYSRSKLDAQIHQSKHMVSPSSMIRTQPCLIKQFTQVDYRLIEQ